MKVLHIIPSFYPAVSYGGPIESVYGLCQALARLGCEVRVLTTDAGGTGKLLDVRKEVDLPFEPGFTVRYCRRIFPESISWSLLRALPAYIRWADVVHLTAVYNFPTIPSLALSKRLKKPLVWSPRGGLQRWSGSRRKALKQIWEMMCGKLLPERFVFHVTSEQEERESAPRFSGSRLAVIPNGVVVPDTPLHSNSSAAAPVGRQRSPGVLRLLYLGRLDPKKGIENLIEALAILEGQNQGNWRLTIAGTGPKPYSEKLREKVSAYPWRDRVTFTGDVRGEAKRRLFDNADVTCFPSHTENFGMAAAEALAHGVPVIASLGTPWARVEEIGCGLWVENSPESLADAIRRISGMPLEEMGPKGRAWMEREFAWPAVAGQMLDLYRNLSGSPALPDRGSELV